MKILQSFFLSGLAPFVFAISILSNCLCHVRRWYGHRINGFGINARAFAARAACVAVCIAHRTAAIAVPIRFRCGRIAGDTRIGGDHLITFGCLVVVLVDVLCVSVGDVVIAVLLLVIVLMRFGERAFAAFLAIRATARAITTIFTSLLAAVRMLTQTVRFQRMIRTFGRTLIQLLLRILLVAFVRFLAVPTGNGWLLRRCQRIVTTAISAKKKN